jgi:DNA topoisomerase II
MTTSERYAFDTFPVLSPAPLDESQVTGGRNGYGAKLANIYSTEFVVETADRSTKQKYKQVFSNNMSTKGKPKITENKKDEEYTRITFTPDFKRFGMSGIDDDTEALMKKRVYDSAALLRLVSVSFANDGSAFCCSGRNSKRLQGLSQR